MRLKNFLISPVQYLNPLCSLLISCQEEIPVSLARRGQNLFVLGQRDQFVEVSLNFTPVF